MLISRNSIYACAILVSFDIVLDPMISMYFGAVTQDISAVSGVCLLFLLAFQLFPRFLVLLGSTVVRGFDTNVAFVAIGLIFGVKFFPRFLVLLGSTVVRGFDTNVARVVFGLSLSSRLALRMQSVTRRVVLM